MKKCIRLTIAASVFIVSPFTSILAQRIPSCTSEEAQTRTRAAVMDWFSSTLASAVRENPSSQNARLLDVDISIPWAQNAFMGGAGVVLKCSVTGTARVAKGSQISTIRLERVMVYYAYDREGNFVVKVNPAPGE
jgi:hypothetical protein